MESIVKSEWHDENGVYQRVKSAWQTESGFYELRNGFYSVPDQVTKMISEEELEKLMEVMDDYNFIIIMNPIYEQTLNNKTKNGNART